MNMENVNKSSVENKEEEIDLFTRTVCSFREIFYKNDCNFYLVVNDDTNHHQP